MSNVTSIAGKRVLDTAHEKLKSLIDAGFSPPEIGSIITYIMVGFAGAMGGDGEDLILHICAMARVNYRSNNDPELLKQLATTPGMYESEINRVHAEMKR